jgi:hypothetical protein
MSSTVDDEDEIVIFRDAEEVLEKDFYFPGKKFTLSLLCRFQGGQFTKFMKLLRNSGFVETSTLRSRLVTRF